MNELNSKRLKYNKSLKQKSRTNRYQMTKAEACLGKYVLNGRKVKGYSFNRQRPVLNYIADFMCKELKLIIEVDGSSHLFEDVMKKDLIRQTRLEKAGFTVIRYTNEQVLRHISTAKENIY
jgi:very-short-patch-repair endonuclease